jgi:hypothetical protein
MGRDNANDATHRDYAGSAYVGSPLDPAPLPAPAQVRDLLLRIAGIADRNPWLALDLVKIARGVIAPRLDEAEYRYLDQRLAESEEQLRARTREAPTAPLIKLPEIDESARNCFLELGAAANELHSEIGAVVDLLGNGRLDEAHERLDGTRRALAQMARGCEEAAESTDVIATNKHPEQAR